MFGKKKEKERVKAVYSAILDKIHGGAKIAGIGGNYVVGSEEGARIRITFEGGHVLSFDVKDVEFRLEEGASA